MKTDSTAYRSAVGVALAAAFILLLPLLAMQITHEVVWDLADFTVAWTLLFGAGITYTLVARRMSNIAYRSAVAVAVATVLLLVWMNLAVGLIGNEDNPAAVIALIAGVQHASDSSVFEILGLNGFFAVLFLGSAWLFRKAAREQPAAGTRPEG